MPRFCCSTWLDVQYLVNMVVAKLNGTDGSLPGTEPLAGVRAVAALFFLVATYLLIVGGVMLVSPGAVSMTLGAPLLGGLELAGPYMFLLMAGIGTAVGWGLLRLNPWARRAAILAALLGVVELVPTVSIAVIELRARPLIWGGIGVMVRVMIAWYLYQEPVAEAFAQKSASAAES